MKYFLSAILLLAFVLSSCANVPTTAEAGVKTQIEIVGGNEESLREFIRHWVLPFDPDGTDQKIIVYIGHAPKDIPYDLPAPDDARLIGSVTGTWVEYVLVFDTNLSPESVHQFYAQALKDRGWKASLANEGGGLIATPDFEVWKDYCYGDDAVLGVQTQSISAEKTSIRLNLHTSAEMLPCNVDPNIDETLYLIYDHIPALRHPTGMTMGTGSANTGEGEAQTTLTLIGDLSAAEVADFYNEQLLAGGWEMLNSGHAKGAAWSNWTFQDEQGAAWIGSLIAVKSSPERNYLFAVVTVEKSK